MTWTNSVDAVKASPDKTHLHRTGNLPILPPQAARGHALVTDIGPGTRRVEDSGASPAWLSDHQSVDRLAPTAKPSAHKGA